MHVAIDPPPVFLWDTPEQPRACQLCDHGKPSGGRQCTHPELRGASTHDARRFGGACGPEAKHLTFPGLQPLRPFARVLP